MGRKKLYEERLKPASRRKSNRQKKIKQKSGSIFVVVGNEGARLKEDTQKTQPHTERKTKFSD